MTAILLEIEALRETAEAPECRRKSRFDSPVAFLAANIISRLGRIYLNAMEAARKLKPQLPVAGENGIPLRDEIEMERIL